MPPRGHTQYHLPVPLPLAVAIVCKNNEATIARTLDSVKGWAQVIIALDSGSTDRTIPILEAAGATVVRTEWLGHVKTKQKALEAGGAACPWVLSIDSDESVEPDLRGAIERALAECGAEGSGVNGFRVNRKVWYAGGYLNHAWQPERRLRLVRAGCAAWGGIDPHDELRLNEGRGKPRDLDGTLRHDAFTDFADFLGKQVQYGRITAQGLHARGQRGRVLRLATSPAGAFLKQMILKQAFLDGWRGWLAATATAVAAAAKHAALIEMTQQKQVNGRKSGT